MSPRMPRLLEPVLAAYGEYGRPLEIQTLGSAGGFSGASLWKLDTQFGALCLRRWPDEGPDDKRLGFIHHVLFTAVDRGCHWIPAPLRTLEGSSFTRVVGSLWELQPWMPGIADFKQHPSHEKLSSAMVALAGFHEAMERTSRPAPAPVVVDRIRLIETIGSEFDQLEARISSHLWPELAACADPILNHFSKHAAQVHDRLRNAAGWSVPHQPCLRDIWHDHVLFQGDQVSGFVDFGAVRSDCVAGDIARLLGSLVGDDCDAWERGLGAYLNHRRLEALEQELISICDESQVLMSGMNWLRWVYLQDRQFPDREGVIRRVEAVLQRIGARSRPD